MNYVSGRAEMNSERAQPGLIPCIGWLRGYRKDWLRYDVMAGLITAAVIVPKAMAYATVAGLPVQVGLYTAFLPMLIYAVLGTSRPLSVSTTTTLAILTGAEIGQVVPAGDPASLLGASAMLTLLVGAALVLASLLRLGFVANFISEPVLIGFKAGTPYTFTGAKFTSLTVPASVTSMGSMAFNSAALQTVTMLSSVPPSGYAPFPQSVTKISVPSYAALLAYRASSIWGNYFSVLEYVSAAVEVTVQ